MDKELFACQYLRQTRSLVALLATCCLSGLVWLVIKRLARSFSHGSSRYIVLLQKMLAKMIKWRAECIRRWMRKSRPIRAALRIRLSRVVLNGQTQMFLRFAMPILHSALFLVLSYAELKRSLLSKATLALGICSHFPIMPWNVKGDVNNVAALPDDNLFVQCLQSSFQHSLCW